MGLRLIFDFTNAVDPDTGETVTRKMLEEAFVTDQEAQEMRRLGMVMTIEED